jgi:low affinity Fe/Cu permease
MDKNYVNSLYRVFDNFSKRVEYAIGTPWAFITAIALIAIWAALGPLFSFSDSWQLVVNSATTVLTWLMLFCLQATQTRDNRAIHLKLDELLRAIDGARTPLALAEEMPTADLDRLHNEMRDAALREGEPPPL